MKNEDVVKELRQRVKPYLYLQDPPMSQSTFSLKLRDADLGISKPVTLVKFFGRFGYIGSYDNWQLDPAYVIPSTTKVS